MKKLIAISLIILACSTFAWVHAKSEDGIRLDVKSLGDNTHQIDAYLTMQAPDTLLWKAISEYEEATKFVESIKSSKVLKREGNNVLLDMNGGGWFVVNIKVHLLLDMVETLDQKKIDFIETSGDEFFVFKGFWQVTKNGEKSTIHLSLLEKPKKPYFGITKMIIKRSISGLFESIQIKILKDLLDQALTKI